MCSRYYCADSRGHLIQFGGSEQTRFRQLAVECDYPYIMGGGLALGTVNSSKLSGAERCTQAVKTSGLLQKTADSVENALDGQPL